jgi:hypothetical protein
LFYAWAGKGARAIEAAVGDAAPGSRLATGGPPIVSEAESRSVEPDCLIAPATLKREMLERWRERILVGAKLIFATPRPHMVNAGNYASEFGKSLTGGDGGGGSENLRSILRAAGGLRLVADRGGRKSA